MKQWLDVVGIGEDGLDGLSSAARSAVENAEVIIGGDRHHNLAPHNHSAERVRWSSPFSKMTQEVSAHRGRRTVLLVTGDPLWYSAGARVARMLPLDEVCFHPQISAYQLACARMGWILADVETLTAHGRPVEQIIPYFLPGSHLVVLTGGSAAPGEIAKLLCQAGFAASPMTVLGALGGPRESRIDGTAKTWAANNPENHIPAFHTLCIECVAEPDIFPLACTPGLPDNAFETDGNFTKQDIRAVTISMLAPRRGALLWDIGIGCGTVSIEWMRSARDSRAIGVDPNAFRLELARKNALKLGTPALELVNRHAPEALPELPKPDAVFLGGGLSFAAADIAINQLRPFGRLVANAVTLEGESLLAELHNRYGGELSRIAISKCADLGSRRGWRSQMSVTQWRFHK